jgi:hypothetical protein
MPIEAVALNLLPLFSSFIEWDGGRWTELNTTGFQKAFDGQFQANNANIPKPPDWQETISLSYGTPESLFTNNVILFPRSYEFCINYWPNADTATIR